MTRYDVQFESMPAGHSVLYIRCSCERQAKGLMENSSCQKRYLAISRNTISSCMFACKAWNAM